MGTKVSLVLFKLNPKSTACGSQSPSWNCWKCLTLHICDSLACSFYFAVSVSFPHEFPQTQNCSICEFSSDQIKPNFMKIFEALRVRRLLSVPTDSLMSVLCSSQSTCAHSHQVLTPLRSPSKTNKTKKRQIETTNKKQAQTLYCCSKWLTLWKYVCLHVGLCVHLCVHTCMYMYVHMCAHILYHRV